MQDQSLENVSFISLSFFEMLSCLHDLNLTDKMLTSCVSADHGYVTFVRCYVEIRLNFMFQQRC